MKKKSVNNKSKTRKPAEKKTKKNIKTNSTDSRSFGKLEQQKLEIQKLKEKLNTIQVELNNAHNKYSNLFNFIPIGFITVNSKGRINNANLTTENLFGIDKYTLLKKYVTSLVYKEDIGNYKSHFQNIISTHESQQFKLRFKNKKEKIFWAHVIMDIVENSDATIQYQLIITDISDYMKVEETLGRNRELFEEMGRVAKIGGWEFNLITGKVSYTREVATIHEFNSEIESDLDYKLSLYQGESKNKIEIAIKEAVELGKSFDLELELITITGIRKWVRLIGRPIKQNGKVICIRGSLQDITLLKNAENTIRENQTKYQAIFESTGTATVIVEEDTTISMANDECLTVTGYKPTELIGEEWTKFVSHEYLSEMLKNHALRRKDPSLAPPKYEVSLIHKSGEIRNTILDIGMIPGTSQSIISMIDITERKRAEESLQKSEEKYRNLVDNMNDGIFISDEKGKVLFANNALAHIHGFNSAEELLNRNFIDFIEQSAREEIIKRFTKEMKSRDNIDEVEMPIVKVDGSIAFILVKPSFIRVDKGITAMSGIVNDITEKKKMLDELIKSKERAEQSDKLKSEFLAQMSHEIRTPLNVVIGNVEYLNGVINENTDPEARDCLEEISLASKRIIRTIDTILNLSELQTSGYEPDIKQIDLNSDVLAKLFQEHQPSAKQSGLEFTYKCESTDTNVFADEYSMVQVFENIIDNAIKFTKKGKVEIILRKNTDEKNIVEIKDTGVGMNEDFLPKLFEFFVQEDQGLTRSYEGNGLGLALVKKYCDLNNVVMRITSEKNVGSIFTIIFNE